MAVVNNGFADASRFGGRLPAQVVAVQTASGSSGSGGFGSNSRHADKPICQCQECGSPYVQTQPSWFFCADPCKSAFNNRRAKRGAEIYDLIMVWRFERPIAKARGVFPLLCRIASAWREEDKVERAGRRSWSPITVTSERLNRHRAAVVRRGRK